MATAKAQERHVDNGVWVGWFAKDVLAVCPKCGGPAAITCDRSYRTENSRVSCLKCSFHKTADELSWSGAVNGIAKARCPHCGFKWLARKFTRKAASHGIFKFTGITCSSCQRTTKVQIDWYPDRIGRPTDPSFGLPLWLQSPCCTETLWAYNAAHLQALRDYIAAGLREGTSGHHWSMFARLPKWMSAHKNRDAVLLRIERLEERLKTLKN